MQSFLTTNDLSFIQTSKYDIWIGVLSLVKIVGIGVEAVWETYNRPIYQTTYLELWQQRVSTVIFRGQTEDSISIIKTFTGYYTLESKIFYTEMLIVSLLCNLMRF